MKKEDKLFLFGSMGLLANILFYIVYHPLQWHFWDAWLYEGGAYPDFLYNYGDLIAQINFILLFVFLGFTVAVLVFLGFTGGADLGGMMREEDK